MPVAALAGRPKQGGYAVARRRRRRNSRRIWVVGSLVCVAGVWTYGSFISPVLEGEAHVDDPATSPAKPAAVAPSDAEPTQRGPAIPKLTSNRPETDDPQSVAAALEVPEKGRTVPDQPEPTASPAELERAASLLDAGMNALQHRDLLTARAHLSEAVTLGLSSQRLIDARAALTRIAAETVFSPEVIDGDPFVTQYAIAPGDTLGKIAKKHDITPEFLAAINGITNPNMIRAGQRIKIVQGPFDARIDKSEYRMDLYLRTTLVKSYPVGLGANNGTPLGTWKVSTKLTNPTYYPPRGGAIIAADDPANPIGEHWIGLVGVSGSAMGAERYGIHGTIEPESIGKSMSLGCVRMHNADVAEVYMLLIPEKSKVTIEP